MWDDWNAGDEDPQVRERVEMSFESVRLEKSNPASPRGVGMVRGDRSVSSQTVSSQTVGGGDGGGGGGGTPWGNGVGGSY